MNLRRLSYRSIAPEKPAAPVITPIPFSRRSETRTALPVANNRVFYLQSVSSRAQLTALARMRARTTAPE